MPRSPSATRLERLLSMLPYGVLALSLAAGGIGALAAAEVVENRDQRRFEGQVEATEGHIAERLETYEAILLAGRGLFEARGSVTREEFNAFVGSLDLGERYPGIQGIGYSRRLDPDQAEEFVESVRASGWPGFRIWPEHARAEYHTIVYLQPLDDRNQAAMGYDMFTEEVRREAMERARETGLPALSGKVKLVQEIHEEKQAGFVLYVPYFRLREDGSSALEGYVYASFRAGDLMEGIFRRQRRPKVDFALYDGPLPESSRLLHRTAGFGAAGEPSQFARIPLDLAQRRWTLEIVSNPAFDEGSGRWLVPYFGGTALLLGLSVFAIARTLVLGRLRAERQERKERFLSEATAALSGSLDLHRTLETLADLVVPRLAEGCAVYEVRPGGGVEPVARRGETEAGPDADGRFDAAAARVAETARPETLRRPGGSRSALVLPLVTRDRSAAVLVLDGLTREAAEDLAETGAQLAARAATAIEHAELYRATRTARAEAEALLRVGATFSSELDLARVVQAVTDAGRELCDAEIGALFYNVAAPEGGTYMLSSLSGPQSDAFAAFPMPRATPLFGPTFRGEAVVRLDDVHSDPRFGQMAPLHGMPPGHPPVASYLAVPVRSRNGPVLGGLFFGHSEPGRFTERHERLVVGLAAQAAVAIDNARLFEAERQARVTAGERAKALTDTNAELEQFAYVASHDLQEPLRMVLQYLGLIERRLGAGLDERSREFLRFASEGASRMHLLINDLLTYARVGRAEPPADEEVDLEAALGQALENLAPKLAEVGAVVTHDPLPRVPGREVQFVQVFQNLVGNALKFRGEEAPRVHVSVVEQGEQWTFEVRDNGIGIAPEYRERVFEVFQRLHARHRYPGTGIGLSICRKIVTRHGGRIWAEAAPDGGTAIRFTLPRARVPAGASA